MGNVRKKELGLAIFLFFYSIYIIIYLRFAYASPSAGKKRAGIASCSKKGGRSRQSCKMIDVSVGIGHEIIFDYKLLDAVRRHFYRIAETQIELFTVFV